MKNKTYHKQLDELIIIMKKSGFLNDDKVESAFRMIPRHEFVPIANKEEAYENKPLLIMKNQTISQPSVVSRMTEWLDVKKGQRILEIGTGSGWQTAILSYMVESGNVCSIERHPQLVEFARKNLDKLGVNNVRVILGDGGLGFPDESPFDRIIITAACKKIPDLLMKQLSVDGLLIAPVGGFPQSLVLLKKTPNGIVEIKNETGYSFVPFLNNKNREK